MNSPEAVTKPTRWPFALLVAFITGIAAAALAMPISDGAMEAHHVSSMEGGRACAVIAIWMPLAFIVGFLVGFFLTLRLKGRGFGGYAKCQLLALALAGALVCLAGGLGWATANHPPRIDGKDLALDIEVRVPTSGRSVEELKTSRFSVAFVVDATDRNYSTLRWDEAVRTDEFITVPAWATLFTKNAGRRITAGQEGDSRQIFEGTLPASPKIDEAWSEWVPPRERFDHTEPAPGRTIPGALSRTVLERIHAENIHAPRRVIARGGRCRVAR